MDNLSIENKCGSDPIKNSKEKEKEKKEKKFTQINNSHKKI